MASEIIVSINVQSGKAEVSLKKAKVSVDKLAAAEKRLVEVQKDEAVGIAKVNLQIKERIQVNNQLAAEQLKNVKKSSGQFRTQVGLNNAILTEAGRAASDARFGFNGVANNVGQLASLFGSLINTSDNVLTSLKNLGKSLLGTGGILIAIQLLIAYGDRIYNFFTGISESAAKTEKAFKKLEGTIASQRKELEGYLVVLQDTSVSEEVRANALNELNVIGEDVINSYKNQKISQEELTLSVEHYMKQQRLRAQLDAIISSNSDLFAEKERIDRVQGLLDEEKTLEGREKIYNENTNLIEKFLNATNTEIFKATGGKGLLKKLIDGDDETKDFATVFRLSTAGTLKEAKDITDQLIDIESQLEFKGNKKTGRGSGRDTREFKEKLFDIQSIVDKFNKEADKLNVRTLDERIDLEEKYAKISADSKLNRFIQTQSKRLEEYKEQVKDDKNAKELIKNAENDFNGSIVDAKIKHGLAIASIEEGFVSKRILAKDKEAEKLGKIARKLENNEIDRLKFSVGANEAFFNQKIKQAEGDKQDADDRILRAEQLKLSEVEIAQAKADSVSIQNTLIDLNLAKEISAIEAKKSIQMEFVGFAQGISSLLGNIDKGNEDLRKAALVIGKGAAIADIVIKAQAANAISIAADTASGGLTTPVNAPLRLRNNISAGISIANILATTISSFKNPSSGGSSGSGSGANVSAPSFNVVGASATNQLAQTVAGQVNAPLRAYVVGSDISDQQELDRSIISTAGIG